MSFARFSAVFLSCVVMICLLPAAVCSHASDRTSKAYVTSPTHPINLPFLTTTTQQMMRRLKEGEAQTGKVQEAARIEKEQLERGYDARLQEKERALAAAEEGKEVLARQLEEEAKVCGCAGVVGVGCCYRRCVQLRLVVAVCSMQTHP